MTNTFGIDISKWNTSQDGLKVMDFDTVKAHEPKVTFVACRAGVSWGYKDPCFDYYWRELARVAIPRLAYHVPYFGESVTRQMDFLFSIVKSVDWTHDRLVLDLEVAGDSSMMAITDTTLQMLNICKARIGRYPLVYSRATWVNQYLNASALPILDWWLAQYLYALPYPLYTPEHPGPPTLPRGVNTWLIHQTAEYGKSIGSPGNRRMDYNRWNGTEAGVLAYFGYAVEPEPVEPEPVEPPMEVNVLFQAKCIIGSLYKRKGAGGTYPTAGYLVQGQVVSVYEIKNGWYRIDASQQIWCSGSPAYMQKLTEPVLPPVAPATIEDRLDDHERRLEALEGK